MCDFKLTDSGKPRYIQIAEVLERDIVTGALPPGERLMTHRELARIAGVTVSTATRAYAEVEKRGLIKTMVGRGTFVTPAVAVSPLDAETGKGVELGLALPLHFEEPKVKPVLQKIFLEEDVETLVKHFKPLGYPHHREIAAGWLRRQGVEATTESLVIAAGYQHGLYTIFHALFKAEDNIAVGYLTTPSVKTLASQAGFNLRGVKMDAFGMIPDELDALCKTGDIKGVYIAGGVQNPSALPLKPERCAELAEVIARHNLVVVEDDGFFLRKSGNTSIATMAPGNTIFLSSFSMVMYSALRVAFIHAPPRFHSRIAQALMENMWTVAPLCVAVACGCITSGLADKAIKLKQQELIRRVHLVRDTLAEFDVAHSEQSLFAWLRLPASWDSRDFEYLAGKSGVRVLAADKLAVPGAPVSHYIRLALTGPKDLATLKKGLDILVSLLKREGGVINPLW